MPPLEVMISFLIATTLFAYIPGPSMLYATAQTMASGRRAGLLASAGIHLGGYVHVIAAALGLAALFEAVPLLYQILKLLGAAYLIILGIRIFLAAGTEAGQVYEAPARRTDRMLFQSVIVEVLNPKTAIFFVAFLPQFTSADAALPLGVQFLVLGIVVNIVFTSAELVGVLFADRIASRLRSSPSVAQFVERAGGALLVAIGCKVALDRN